MKKNVIVLIILLLVSLVFVAVGSKVLTDSAERVTLEERASFGDKAEAEGLRINIPVRTIIGYRRRQTHLLWDTKVTMDGIPAGETKVTLDLERNYGLDPRMYGDDGIRISTTVSEITSVLRADAKTMNGLEAVCKDVASEKNLSELWGKIVRLNDYYDKYPFLVEVYLGGQKYGGEFGYWAGAEDAGDEITNIGKSIDMNLLPNYPYSIQMYPTMGNRGNILSYRCSTYQTEANIFSVSDVTDTDIYYGADIRCTDGSRPEAIIGDGYGIWRIGYKLIEAGVDGQTDKEIQFTENEPELIWPMDTKDILLEMCISEDQREMLLFTGVDGKYVMSVIDLTTGQERQRLELMEYEVSSGLPEISYVFQTENVVVPFLAEDKLTVISKTDTGEYALEFIIDRDFDGQGETESYLADKHGEMVMVWNRHPATVEMAWQDGKLAMVYALTNEHGSGKGSYQHEQPCAFWVAVYDQTGLLYGGEYYLSHGIGEYIDFGNKITDIRYDARMGIDWSSPES